MSAYGLIAGKVASTPRLDDSLLEPCSIASLIVKTEGAAEIWRVVAFGSLRAALLKFEVGEVLAVIGDVQVRLIDRNGSPEIERTLIFRDLISLPTPATVAQQELEND